MTTEIVRNIYYGFFHAGVVINNNFSLQKQ